MELFEQASRLKLSFPSNKGLYKPEDLWDLKLTDLDTLAKGVNKQLKADQEESFITTRSKSNTTLQLQLDILVHVIKVKQEEETTKKLRGEKKAQKDFLEDLLKNKQLQELQSLTPQEIQARIDALGE